MKNITLIFSENAEHLGELLTQDDMLMRFVLTQPGEVLLAHEVEDWQTSGITVFRDVTTKRKEGILHQALKQQISPRDAEFLTAFRHWASEHALRLITLRSDAVPCWEKILMLPFESEERFAAVFALSRLSVEDIGAWSDMLDEAKRVVDTVT